MIGLVIVIIVALIVVCFISGLFLQSAPKKQQPYFHPYNKEPSDIDKMEDELFGNRGSNLTEEDLKILFGEPKPSTEIRNDQSEKVTNINSKHEIRLIKSDDSHITIDMFNEMYITEKSSFLWRGRLLYTWHERKTEVCLFAINNFYVERRVLDGKVLNYVAYESLEQPTSGNKPENESGKNKEKPYDCPHWEQDDDLPF